MPTELTAKLNQLAQLAQEIGAEGVWLFRGATDAHLIYTPNEPVKVNSPLISANLSIRFDIADTGVLVIMRFPDDGGQHGVEYKMNTADRAKLQQLLVKALDQAFEEASGEVRMPLLGDSSLYHMANSVINILEAFEDVEDYIGNQLSDEERESLGI